MSRSNTKPSPRHILAGLILVVISAGCIPTPTASALEFTSSKHVFTVETVLEGLSHPWGMVFLSDSDLLITERTGNLRL
ncbi:MAG: hypothetical protein WD709_05580, partial [Gammaproteobacteria bacterium]